MGRRITVKFVLYVAIGWYVVLAGGGEAMAHNSGIELLAHCWEYLHQLNTREDLFNSLSAGLCVGYIEGVTDTQLEVGKKPYCLPKQVGNFIQRSRQTAQVVVKHLEGLTLEDREELQSNASLLVQRALMEAFPCPEGEQQ